MSYGFLDAVSTPGVRAAQAAMGVGDIWADFKGHREFDRLGPDEAAFVAARDSVYIATSGETGWPYLQHRGGPPGFLKVLDETTLAFSDYRGNLQYISVGNLSGNDRVALILLDYPRRARMKILARAEILSPDAQPELTERVVEPEYKAKVERIVLLHLVAFDWNCSQHITPRFTQAEVQVAIRPLLGQVAALEAEVAALRARLGEGDSTERGGG